MEKAIERMRNHYIICGVGHNGENAVNHLVASDHPFVMIDRLEERCLAYQVNPNGRIPYLVADATEDATLRRAGIERAVGLIAALPSDQDNIMLVLSARQLNPLLRIVSKVSEASARNKLRKVGADGVVSPSEMGGLRLFSELVRPGVMTFLDDLIQTTDQNLRIDELPIPEGSPLDGCQLAASDIRRRTNLLVVGVRQPDDGAFIYNPGPEFVVKSHMAMIVLGPIDAIEKLKTMIKKRV